MTTLAVDPKKEEAYYQAATNCFDAVSALRDSFLYIFGELSGCGSMAGVDENGQEYCPIAARVGGDAMVGVRVLRTGRGIGLLRRGRRRCGLAVATDAVTWQTSAAMDDYECIEPRKSPTSWRPQLAVR
jgi:hypothetical protein